MRNEDHETHILLEKQDVKQYRRGLLDVLNVHACAGSEIGSYQRKIRTSGSKDGIPYEPSLKSLPCSSSEESVQLTKTSFNCENNTKTTENNEKSFQENSNVRRANVGRNRRNLFSKGRVMRNVSSEVSVVPDIIPEQSNESLLNNDYRFNNFNRKSPKSLNKTNNIHSIIDNESHSTEENNETELSSLLMSEKEVVFGFERDCVSSEHELNQETNQIAFWSIEENPECNSEGKVPLTRSFAESGGAGGSNQNLGDILFKTRKEKTYQTKHNHIPRNILRLFDCHKYPLTDTTGNILYTANNQALVIFKNGKPQYDCSNRLVFDEYGESSLSPKFKPHGIRVALKKGGIISEIPLFDFRGYPLVDHDGSSLLNSSGNPLIITDSEGNLLHDINMHPIFDKYGIPVTKINDCWVTPSGKPFRVFDKLKHPLTDSNGKPLCNVNNVELLLCDQHGRPIFDYNNEPVFDVNGFKPSDVFFSPSLPPEFSRENVITVIENKPVQIFDSQGFPLTEDNGKVLKDAKGKYLLETNHAVLISSHFSDCKCFILHCCFRDNSLNRIFPSTCHSAFDNNLGHDGTKNHNQVAITDKKGKFVYNIEGKQIYQEKGDKVFVNSSERSSNISLTEHKSKMFSSLDVDNLNYYTSDYTTDDKSNQLSNLNNTEESLEISFQMETDVYGRPLFDSLNRPLFDKYGRPIYDLFLRPLYDSNGRPISDANGKRLSDGRDEAEMQSVSNDFGYKNNECNLHLMQGKKDLNGGPLFDKLGQPLYNKNGKPMKDAFGRPLYNDDGKPFCNEDGLPVSKQIRLKSGKIRLVEDKFQKLIVYPENTPGGLCNERSIGSKENNDIKYYYGRVRITTFTDGEQVIELLEIAPPLEDHK